MMSEEIIGRDVRDFSYDNMMEYNQNVIINRALPSVYDGLKPVQRKILYSTFKDGHLSSKKFVKSAKIIGSVMGNFHPHSDSSSYDAMVNLIRDYTNNQPLMEGHGAFSSILGDTAAAMRYCITGDTLLLNSDSSLVKFKDIIEQSEEGTYNFSIIG